MNLHHGDCFEVMQGLPDNSVDLVLTDPPYGLAFMGKKWDYDVPRVEIWAEALRVLKPGGHLLAFAGTRTQHRMACRIEDAGFEIRDMLAWVYGSGFPKSLDVSKAIDKAAGAEREVVGRNPYFCEGRTADPGEFRQGGKNSSSAITAPATDAAREWAGWGTALKPALEPITMARKPLVGTVAANVLEYGTGGLNIDACRVGSDADWTRPGKSPNNITGKWGSIPQASTGGRWPANLIHDGSDEVLALMPMTGKSTGGDGSKFTRSNFGMAGTGCITEGGKGFGDSGSAARFFYCAKASKRERDAVRPTTSQRTKHARRWPHGGAGCSARQPPPHGEAHRAHGIPVQAGIGTRRGRARPVHGQRYNRHRVPQPRARVHRHRTGCGLL
jgi:site-specific DNA-methyltransferase (adenine-specific)